MESTLIYHGNVYGSKAGFALTLIAKLTVASICTFLNIQELLPTFFSCIYANIFQHVENEPSTVCYPKPKQKVQPSTHTSGNLPFLQWLRCDYMGVLPFHIWNPSKFKVTLQCAIKFNTLWVRRRTYVYFVGLPHFELINKSVFTLLNQSDGVGLRSVFMVCCCLQGCRESRPSQRQGSPSHALMGLVKETQTERLFAEGIIKPPLPWQRIDILFIVSFVTKTHITL